MSEKGRLRIQSERAPENWQSLRGRRVTVLGGLGFIGSNLCRALVSEGAHVCAFDNLSAHGGGAVANLTDIENEVRIQLSDVHDSDALKREVQNTEFIVNCAAETSHSSSMTSPWRDVDTNVLGVLRILETIRHSDRNVKFVQIGTTTQFGLGGPTPLTEISPE